MATRWYLRNTTPTDSPGETEQSTALPSGTGVDAAHPVQALDTTAGDTGQSRTAATLGQTARQDIFFTSFSSVALAAQTIPAATWTFAARAQESNAAANAFFCPVVYVWRPSNSTVVGYIYDAITALGAEFPTTAAGRVMTFAGSSLAVLDGDILVLEVWVTATQSMSTSYTLTLSYNSATPVTDGDTSAGGSYLETPDTITFYTPSGAVVGEEYFNLPWFERESGIVTVFS